MHHDLGLGRELLDEVAELRRVGAVGGNVVADDARLLNGHDVPRLGHEFLRQGALGSIESARVLRFLFVLLHLLPMLRHRAAADAGRMLNEDVPRGLRDLAEILRGVAGKAVAHGQQPHGLFCCLRRRGRGLRFGEAKCRDEDGSRQGSESSEEAEPGVFGCQGLFFVCCDGISHEMLNRRACFISTTTRTARSVSG